MDLKRVVVTGLGTVNATAHNATAFHSALRTGNCGIGPVSVFVVKGVAPDVPLNTIFRGIWPFWFAMLLSLVILVIFPQIALFLPEAMF